MNEARIKAFFVKARHFKQQPEAPYGEHRSRKSAGRAARSPLEGKELTP